MSEKTLLDVCNKELASVMSGRDFVVSVDSEGGKIKGVVLDGLFTADDLDNLALIISDYQGKKASDLVD